MLKVKISGNNSCKFLDIFMRSLIMWWVMIEKPVALSDNFVSAKGKVLNESIS